MTEVPTEVTLTGGGQTSIQLPGLGTSGYVWDHEVAGPEDVIDVTWSRGFPPGSVPQAVGVSAPEVATIVACRQGTIELRLYQHRRWEHSVAPRVDHRITVIVLPAAETDRIH